MASGGNGERAELLCLSGVGGLIESKNDDSAKETKQISPDISIG